MRPLCQIFSVALIMFHYISVGANRCRRDGAELIRARLRRRALVRHVADQAVEFVGDFGEILIGAAAVFGAFGFDENQTLAMNFEQFGLAPFQFRNNDRVILEILDGLFEIGHLLTSVTALPLFSQEV